MKISHRTRADFEFFRDTDLDMVGHEVGVSGESDHDGHSALECWYSKDTHGQELPCRERDLLAKAMRGKASWNLQVKMWSEGIAEETLFQWELVDMCHGLPAWIFDATMKQAKKILRDKIAPDGKPFGSYLPTFMKVSRVFGQWIPPWMLNFDPVI